MWCYDRNFRRIWCFNILGRLLKTRLSLSFTQIPQGAGLILIFVPETKDLTLEEIDSLFGDKRSATADLERMEAIKQEIGLKELLYRASTEVVVAEEEKS